MKFNTVRFKISFLYVAILGIILIVYSSVLYLSLHYTLYNDLDDELMIKVNEIRHTLDAYLDKFAHDEDAVLLAFIKVMRFEDEHPDEDERQVFENRWLLLVDKYDLREDYINFSATDGRSLVHSENLEEKLLSAFSKDIKRALNRDAFIKNITYKGNKIRIITIPFSLKEHQQYVLQVGTPLKPIIHILNNRLLFIVVSIPIILFFAVFLGRLFAARILNPVLAITKTARDITYKDLSARVKAEHIDEEMKYLVEAFNDMIRGLERSFNYIMDFSSHVSHELKTPIAIIIGQSEITLKKRQETDEYIRIINIIMEESHRMLKTINDILLLTKLDYQHDVFNLEKIDFLEFLKEIYKKSEILASSKGIKVGVNLPEKKIYVNGDKLHLRRLLFNIVDNAIKYTPHGGRIDMSANYDHEKVMVSISDTGMGISDQDLPCIFNRFFRGEKKGLKEQYGSTGLGLSIALSIAKIHNGDIRVKSQPGKGTTFTIILPLL